ncbi:hypothetical protein [Kineosporia sp. NBRC 101731]|uniref:DUF6924 domain-containing protein n=1 Tax=Kineosporia sp. NBRC 101731 TaxID=3032199 RepID=UPI0024A14287|nr:hypothetical protein [Kineosporia sp. NBRC 101731]GLY31695.1 hypothetical protein Kisp02_50600 [Kineosporia sp. NBRC 101731]
MTGMTRRSELRPGQFLNRSALTSPAGRFVLRNARYGGATELTDEATGTTLWTVPGDNVYGQSTLVFGLDGDLMVWNHHRERGWSAGTAGRGAVLLRLTDAGDVVLLDAGGGTVWSSGTAVSFDPFPPYEADGRQADDEGPAPDRQHRLAALFDSLAPEHGYTVAVVRDVSPDQALGRWGLVGEERATTTWQELQARRGDRIPVAAVALGPHTLLMAGAPWLPGDPLSTGTTAVQESRRPGCGWSEEWSMHVDGATVSHLREGQPKRRIGMTRPELLRAAAGADVEPHLLGNVDWLASCAGLEFVCLVAGVMPTADDVNGPVLGGLVPVSLAEPPEPEAVVAPPGRPAIPAQEFVLVRTDYSDDGAWAALLDAARRGDLFGDGEMEPVDDPGWDGATPDEVLAAVPNRDEIATVFIVDHEALTGEDYPVLVVNPDLPEASENYEPVEGVSRTLRATADELFSIFANLSIANADWEDYLPDPDAADQVFRGY